MSVREWLGRLRRRLRPPPSVTAVVRCPPEGLGAAQTAAAVATRVWEVVVALDERADGRYVPQPSARPCVRVLRLPADLAAGRDTGLVMKRCRADWILWLHAGEAPSRELLSELPRLAVAQGYTHYRVPVPAPVPGGEQVLEPRLVRNDPATTRPAGRGYTAIGPGLDLEAAIVYVPVAHLPPALSAPFSASECMTLEEVDAAWDERGLDEHTGRLEVVEHDRAFTAHDGRLLHVAVENRGGRGWPGAGWPGAWIGVSYRWLDEAGQVVVPEGLRTRLPGPIGPGERAVVPVSVSAPATGRYLLELDLLDEGVAWFGLDVRVPVVVAEP